MSSKTERGALGAGKYDKSAFVDPAQTTGRAPRPASWVRPVRVLAILLWGLIAALMLNI